MPQSWPAARVLAAVYVVAEPDQVIHEAGLLAPAEGWYTAW